MKGSCRPSSTIQVTGGDFFTIGGNKSFVTVPGRLSFPIQVLSYAVGSCVTQSRAGEAPNWVVAGCPMMTLGQATLAERMQGLVPKDIMTREQA